VLNAEKTTPEERIARIKAETNGRGAEIVVECVGRPEVFPEGLKYLRKAGMYLEQAARFRPSRKTAVRLKKRGHRDSTRQAGFAPSNPLLVRLYHAFSSQ
jgi:hypothetical protein